jgi:leucyl aminopeptidase (aminopeptidase T)
VGDLGSAVETVILQCLAIRPGEQVVVVSDTEKQGLGEAIRAGAAAAGAEAVLMLMDPREVDGQEPPDAVAAALGVADAFLAPTHRSISHTRARKRATEQGVRGATLPQATEDMLARLMDCDFSTLRRRSGALAELLTEAGGAHLTCARGSDLRLDLSGRSGLSDDGDLGAPGAFGNLPCGEGFVAPAGGEGVLFATTIASVGKVAGELPRLTVEHGRLVDATQPEGERLMELLDAAGGRGTNLAELGIGTNERATVTGNILEDEKILGTVHVAFGASAGIGGTVSVPVHLDVLVVEPTLDVGDTRVLERGAFVLDA